MTELSGLLMQLEKHCQLCVEEFDEFCVLFSLLLVCIEFLLHPCRRVLSGLLGKVHQSRGG